MNPMLSKWLKDKDVKRWFKKDNLIVLILAGALLVIIALPTKNDIGSGEEDQTEETWENMVVNSEGGVSIDTTYSDDEYARQLEQRLNDILSHMEGVGQVRVMITLKSSQELVVEKERPYLRSSTTESDSQGGSRVTSQTEMEDNTVYRTNGSVNEPYVVKTLVPRVEGVVVVAQGAGTGTIDRTIVEMVQALFNVEAHKVKVVKMEVAK